ncbi:uncharacterized mitochondrial protein-like protein [Tanacetum coccineum]
MQEELLQFQLKKVWILVSLPNGKRAIGTKWVFRNKKDEIGIVIRNKARLVTQEKIPDEFYEGTHFLLRIAASTPMEPDKALVKDEEADSVDVHLYRSMIGSLMYLTTSRPDITFAVCACARFQVTPKTSHLHAVKRIFRYLKGQPKLGLWYPRDSPFDLEAFSDSNYAGASLDRKSTTGAAWFQGRLMVYKAWCLRWFDGSIGLKDALGQILDFLTSSLINFALTVSPTIYASYIEQFWNTACLKTINSKKQIHANVDVKAVVTTAATSQPPKDPSTYRRTKRGKKHQGYLVGGSPKKVRNGLSLEEMLDSVERAATTTTSLEAE